MCTLVLHVLLYAQLLEILCGLMAAKKGSAQLRFAAGDHDADKWARIAIARLGRRRGTRGFGNARAVRTLFDQVNMLNTAAIP